MSCFSQLLNKASFREICPGLNSATRFTKTAKIRRGTMNGLQDVRGTQQELRILRKLRKLRELQKFARSQRDPTRITKTDNIRKGTKNGLQDVRGTQRELQILRNYENYKYCENLQDLRGTQRELQKLIIFAKVPRMAYKMSE